MNIGFQPSQIGGAGFGWPIHSIVNIYWTGKLVLGYGYGKYYRDFFETYYGTDKTLGL